MTANGHGKGFRFVPVKLIFAKARNSLWLAAGISHSRAC